MVVEWHPGYVLRTDALAGLADYRGPLVVDVALALARGGLITPAVLGQARSSGREDPQVQKWLWHCLAQFGRTEVTGGPDC